MPGLYGVLDMCKWAALAHQAGVEVVAHNLANVNTPGYSRQKVLLETGTSLTTFIGQMGTGVRAVGVQREYDRFITAQLNFEKQILGNWEVCDYNFKRIEEIINDSSDYGLSKMMSEFWNAWQALANSPSGRAERVGLLTTAEAMAEGFSRMYRDFFTLQKDINENLKGVVDDINTLIDQIVELNERISSIELARDRANDFRDQRDVLLDELASRVGFSYFEDSSGQLTVLLESGKPLVQGRLGWHLGVEVDAANDNFYDITWDDNTGNHLDVTASITRGSLKGLLEMRDTVITEYMKKVDRLAAAIIKEVNTLHYYGYGLDGSTENYFFTPFGLVTGVSKHNGGGASISAGTVYDYSVLTLDDYEIRFTSADRYTVYNVTRGSTVSTGYVINASNNTIYFDEDGVTELTAVLASGVYSASEMAAEIERALDVVGTSNYTVTYDSDSESFTISSDGAGGTGVFTIRWASGNGGGGSLAAETLGFNRTGDDNGALSYSSDFAANHAYISGQAITFEGITVTITNGVTEPASGDIFTIASAKDAAKTMAVNSVVASDVNKIAAAKEHGGDDNRNALAIAALRDEHYMNGNTATFDSYYNSIVGEVGVRISGSNRTLAYKQSMVEQLTARKQSISGVNIDEEIANLIRFQQAFTAAAKMINAVNEMLKELMDIV